MISARKQEVKSKIYGVEVSEKDYKLYWQGKKEIRRKAKCYYCKGSQPKKICRLTGIGSGTLSNPQQNVWVCSKH